MSAPTVPGPDDDDASPEPAASPEAVIPTPTDTPSPSPTPDEIISVSDGARAGITEQSRALGGVADRLDTLALEVGSIRVSLFDVMFVVVTIVAVILFAWLATRFSRKVLGRMTRLDSTQQVLAEKILTIAIWILAFMVGVDVLGVDLTALAVFSGAFGLAIGFGLQKTFGNLISGIILLLDKSIKPGDVIAVADQAGRQTFGQIRKIGIRAVSVTTRDEREYLIPNENLMINQVENWSYSSKNVRIQVNVGVSYNADMKLAEELMLEAARKARRVLDTPPPTAWMNEYGDSSVNFTIHCWITDPEEGVGNVRSEVLKNLWWLFKEHGIEIPFPQRDMNLRQGESLDRLIAALEQRPGNPQ